MIQLTRLNHAPLVLNSDLIEHMDVTPDTVVTLTTGQKIVVLESAEEVVDRIIRVPEIPRSWRLCLPAETAGMPAPHPYHNRTGRNRWLKQRRQRPKNPEANLIWRTLGGLVLAVGGILGGLVMEGGKVRT